MGRTIKIYPGYDALTHAAAECVAVILEDALRQNQNVTFALTGGETPKPVYELLAAPPYAERVDWKRVHFLWVDERCVPPEDAESNFGMAWNAMLSKLNVPAAHVHRIPGEMEDVEKAALNYEREIRTLLAGPAIPSFDLVLLGMGKDGHTASLFPGTHWDEERLVVANRVPNTGAARISMTPHVLNEARLVVFLVAGESKSERVAEVLEHPAQHLPASRINPAHGALVWMMDSAAARLLQTAGRP